MYWPFNEKNNRNQGENWKCVLSFDSIFFQINFIVGEINKTNQI